MRNVPYEGSLLASLEELKKIEADRIAEEAASAARAAEEKRLAQAAAVQRAREEAEAKVQAEHEARLEQERARLAAEREARLELEAAQAAERARAAVELETARTYAETQLARDEALRKRPRWMIAVTLGAVAVAGAAALFAANAARTADDARTQTGVNHGVIESATFKPDGAALGAAQDTLGTIKSQVGDKIDALERSVAASEKQALADKDRRAREAAAEAARREADRKHREWLKERQGPVQIDAKCLNNSVCR
ncbi:MAG: hypothetical protein KF773_35910 [Deltaproteobacteria bacterium]|nr:hypothetical protein [Deltaproteobacteria bacterium]